MRQLQVKLRGVADLLMHNSQLANPFNTYTNQLKTLTSKRKKTEDDHLAMSKVEFMGGLYWSEQYGPYMPAKNLESVAVAGARHRKLGKDFQAAVHVMNDAPLLYKGPRDPSALYEAGFVNRTVLTVNRSKILRTRPCFKEWSLEAIYFYGENEIKLGDLVEALETAGRLNGLGDDRPRYGRFEVEVLSS